MSTTEDPRTSDAREQSTAAQALAAAGDKEQARDVSALDDAALAAQKRLGATRSSLVERLIYGPAPSPEELRSGTQVARDAKGMGEPIVRAAIDCLAQGKAFTADHALSSELRKRIAAEKGYAFTVPNEFGGAGASYGELALAEEELAANGFGALAVEISGELTIGAGSLIGYGTETQRKTYLPMLAEGRLMGFALTEVGVGVNAKKIQAYVEHDEAKDCWRLHASGPRAKLYITNACHGGLCGLVARIGKEGKKVGLFVVELPETNVSKGKDQDYSFELESTEVSAFVSNYNSRLSFENFPIPTANQIQADGVEVLFYCLRMGRCMLAAMSAGYQRMLAADAAHFARQRVGVGGKVIKHELPRLNLGKILGGALQARALSHLSLQQDADRVDLAGLRDLTKSAASGTAMDSMLACEHTLGGRTFHKSQRVSDARANLHVFGIVEGEDDLILMGMIKDITAKFTKDYMAGMLGVIQSINVDANGKPVEARERILRIDAGTAFREPGRVALATVRLLGNKNFWGLAGWIAKNAVVDVLRLPGRLIPSDYIPRYRKMPTSLRGPLRWAERKLRGRRWTNLGINLWFQLELTRAQIPFQRLGKSIEHLVSIVALCHHAAAQDSTQRRVAQLQCEILRQKFESIRILSDLRGMDKLRKIVAAVGKDIETGDSTLLRGIKPEDFAQPWEEAD